MRRFDVLHILAPGPVGGLGRVVHALAIGQRALGHEVGVLAILDPGTEDHPYLVPLREAGVRVEPLVLPPRRPGRERQAVASLLRRLRPEVVHTHGYRPDVTDGPVARALGIAAVTTVHGFTGNGLKNRFYEWLQRRAYRRFDAVVAVSRPLVGRLRRAGVPEVRIHCVPNAWTGGELLPAEAARSRLGLTSDCFHLGWVGRLSAEKGPDVLLEALARIPDSGVRASVVGSGRMLPLLRAKAESLGCAGCVDWHGMIADAGPLFRAFDLFVLSSRTEGTPIVLFEAMAAEVPIVATAVGGVPDVVSEREAVLVPPEDPSALAQAIQSVRSDPAAARARAKAARLRLEREFALRPWLERYDAIYRSVVSSYPRTQLV